MRRGVSFQMARSRMARGDRTEILLCDPFWALERRPQGVLPFLLWNWDLKLFDGNRKYQIKLSAGNIIGIRLTR